MAVNSHKQLTQGIMRQFAHTNPLFRGDVVWCLALRDLILPSSKQVIMKGEIVEAATEELGAEFGYYCDEVEKDILGMSVETPFGSFLQELLQQINKTKDPNALERIMAKHDWAIRNFYKFNMFRDDDAINRVNQEKLELPQDLIELWQKNRGVDIGFINNLENRAQQLIELKKVGAGDFADYHSRDGVLKVLAHTHIHSLDYFSVMLIKNTSSKPLIVSKHWSYTVQTVEKEQRIMLPLTPQFALQMIISAGHIGQKIPCPLIIEKSEQVDILNTECFKQELKGNSEFIVGNSAEILDYYKRLEL